MFTKQDSKKRLLKRLQPLFAAVFFQSFVLWFAVEKLFMVSIGFTNSMITVTTALYISVMLLANIPLGILADRWSRRGVLILASTSLVASCIIGGLSHGFWMYTLALSLWGVFYACYMGTYDSVVYDTVLEETGKSESFEYYFGRIKLFASVALVMGSLLSAVVVHFLDLRATYFITAPLAACSLVALYFFKEPTLHKKAARQLMLPHVKDTFSAVLKRGNTVWIVLCLICITAGAQMLFEFDQLWLIALALPVVWYGPVNAFILTATGTSGLLASKIKNNVVSICAVGVVLVLASGVLLTQYRTLIIIAQMIMIACFITIEIIVNRYLHDSMPSKLRTGASSVVTTAGYALFIPVALLFGKISEHFSVFQASWTIIALCSMALMTLVIIVRNKNREVLINSGH